MMEKIKKLTHKITTFRKEKLKGRFLIIFILIYFAVISFFMLWNGMWFMPDQFIIVCFVLALLVAQPVAFIRDWAPFVFLFLGYEYLRGLAPQLKISVNIYPMIQADQFLFSGRLPSVELQKWFYTPGTVRLHDLIFTIIYILQFILPVVFAFILWTRKRSDYIRFVVALITLSYSGFLTYILYPAMPPWMASEQGIIPQVDNIVGETLRAIIKNPHLPTIYVFMNPNPIAAMPSLHAAYMMLIYLFMADLFGKNGKWFILYTLADCVAIVYTGNHYVIDAIFGILYAYAAFHGVNQFYKKPDDAVDCAKSQQDRDFITVLKGQRDEET